MCACVRARALARRESEKSKRKDRKSRGKNREREKRVKKSKMTEQQGGRQDGEQQTERQGGEQQRLGAHTLVSALSMESRSFFNSATEGTWVCRDATTCISLHAQQRARECGRILQSRKLPYYLVKHALPLRAIQVNTNHNALPDKYHCHSRIPRTYLPCVRAGSHRTSSSNLRSLLTSRPPSDAEDADTTVAGEGEDADATGRGRAATA